MMINIVKKIGEILFKHTFLIAGISLSVWVVSAALLLDFAAFFTGSFSSGFGCAEILEERLGGPLLSVAALGTR